MPLCKNSVRLRNFLVQCCILTTRYKRCLISDPAPTINLISGTQREEVWASRTTFPFKFSKCIYSDNWEQNINTYTTLFLLLLDLQHNEAKRRGRVYSHPAAIRLDSPASIFEGGSHSSTRESMRLFCMLPWQLPFFIIRPVFRISLIVVSF